MEKTNLKIRWVISIFLMIVACAGVVSGDVFYVDDDAPDDPVPNDPSLSDPMEDGSAAHPFDAIQEGIDAAFDGDTVIVLEGTYTGNGNRDIDFGGKAITVQSANPESQAVVAVTVIDCQNRGRGFYFHSGESGSSILDGFTIKNGYASDGGGVYCVNVSGPTILDCIFVNNSAAEGGAIRTFFSSPTVKNSIFINNTASDDGGAIENHNGSLPTIINCIFADNSTSGDGGAIRNWNSDHSIINCTFSGNSASQGGGIYNWYSGPNLTNCILWGNSDNGGTDESAQIDTTSIPQRMPNVRYSCIQGLTGGLGGSGNIGDDPLFRGPDDYWLLPESPCIDAGRNAGVYDDIEGNVRPYNYPGVDNNGGLPDFDMGAYEVVVPPIEVWMKFTPQAMNPGSEGKWVKAHLVLAEGFGVDDVDADTSAEIEQLGIESEYMNVFINEDGLVEIEAAFRRGDFCGGVDYAPGEVTVIGRLTSGQYFCGSDIIRIITSKLGYVGSLASYWLGADCGPPDWCGGLDVDQDSVVDWLDFAMSDGCCIEFIEE